MSAPAHTRTAYLHMLWGSCAFALMGAFSHLAGERCDWQFVAVARALVAFAISLAIARASGVRLVLWEPRILWLRSVAGSIGLICCFYALTHLPISDAVTLTNTSSIWVTLLCWLALGERPAKSVLLAVSAGVTGVVLIQQPHFQSGKVACLFALLNAFFTAIAMLGLNRLHRVDPRAVVAHFSGVSSVATILFVLVTARDARIEQLSNGPTLLLLFMVGAMGVLGQIGMTMAFARGPAARVSVVSLSQILFGFLLDLLIWQRAINLVSVVGMFLVVAPTAWLLLHNPLRRDARLLAAQAEPAGDALIEMLPAPYASTQEVRCSEGD
ncbi:MAG TPA: DMT family transporter [Blastocatellia bacterium]|nr:DMT family transporter [Blastocatellia bacterium]